MKRLFIGMAVVILGAIVAWDGMNSFDKKLSEQGLAWSGVFSPKSVNWNKLAQLGVITHEKADEIMARGGYAWGG